MFDGDKYCALIVGHLDRKKPDPSISVINTSRIVWKGFRSGTRIRWWQWRVIHSNNIGHCFDSLSHFTNDWVLGTRTWIECKLFKHTHTYVYTRILNIVYVALGTFGSNTIGLCASGPSIHSNGVAFVIQSREIASSWFSCIRYDCHVGRISFASGAKPYGRL